MAGFLAWRDARTFSDAWRAPQVPVRNPSSVVGLRTMAAVTAPDYARRPHHRSITMIGYVTLGTNDLARAATFYDALLGEIGAKRIMEFDTFIAWGRSMDTPSLGLIKPFDGNAACVGNGVMVALAMKDPAMVDRVYAKAIELGAKDEGPAGPRGDNFYAGYFRDPDGNKLNAFCMTGGQG
jgi:catechol 2,3-dioxygenase-like lactoylglutathione lyase family enzyme